MKRKKKKNHVKETSQRGKHEPEKKKHQQQHKTSFIPTHKHGEQV